MRDPLKPGGAFSLPHGTQIVIGKLEKKVLAELRDAQAMKRLKGEVRLCTRRASLWSPEASSV